MLMHVITNFAETGGAERMLARLLSVSKDDRIVVVPLIGISEHNRKLADNPNVIYAPQGAGSPLTLARATVRLAKLIREERPKAVLCWMYHAMVVGAVAGCIAGTRAPIYWNVRQSLDDPASLSRSSRRALWLGRLLSGLPTGIIYNSARALKLHGQYGYRNQNAIVIPNGFNLPELDLPDSKRPRVLGAAGRFHPQKDYATLFSAAALTLQTHPEAHFIAAGRGLSRDSSAVASLADAIGLDLDRIELRGEVSDISSFYREIDAFVLSSRTEGFPNVVAEAMSYGKPVITTDVGDAAAVVGDTGFVVPPQDKEALAMAMRSMLDLSPEAYAARTRAARNRVEKEYALPRIAKKYRAFLGV